jgi:hypothetical protein
MFQVLDDKEEIDRLFCDDRNEEALPAVPTESA